jgi:hypothetical protein
MPSFTPLHSTRQKKDAAKIAASTSSFCETEHLHNNALRPLPVAVTESASSIHFKVYTEKETMKQKLSTFVATICLLTLFISSAACLALPATQATAMSANQSMTSHTIGSADHACCPTKNDGEPHTSVSCCTVHHQSALATSATNLNTSLEISPASLPGTLFAGATVAPPSGGKTGPPLRRPATKLRI